jgi:hypothetical protein
MRGVSLHLNLQLKRCLWLLGAAGSLLAADPGGRIDRRALVTRHHPHLTRVDPWAPLSVGNGGFCFTADVTGLQTFPDHYQKNGIPLETQARWAWHAEPNPRGYQLADANRPYTAHGRTQGYPTNDKVPAGQWLRENPHAWPLGQLGFVDENGTALDWRELDAIEQTLDLWSGVLRSRFSWHGESVEVTTAVDPAADRLAVVIRSAAVAGGGLCLRLAFPRGHDLRIKNNPALDWSRPQTHATRFSPGPGTPASGTRELAFARARDGSTYAGTLAVTGGEIAGPEPTSPHAVLVRGRAGERELSLVLTYRSGGDAPERIAAAAIIARAAGHWEKFWQSGAAVEFAGSTDPRAGELERRVVLSQYLTAIQLAGDFPPSEGGLTHSSWYQKHHTEMVWWHAAHFALWGRDEFLARNLDAYVRALPQAREIAAGRTLPGARWPKMVGPDWRESPGGNPLIVWNQPHPIHLAELLYRNTPTAATLARYGELVAESAECMAGMLVWVETRGQFVLGPPLWIAQEIYDQATSMNPTYELSYWVRGLTIAQQWRERLGQPRNPEWDRRIKGIAPLPQKDGRYVALESHPDTWENKASRHDHPSFLMALGQLPGDGVDRAVMARTLAAVLTSWDWEAKIWGWDYPMVAMTAARLGEPGQAVGVLLKSDSPNNAYRANGHCPQRGDLPVYLPANGALLAAVAMMAGGWDGSERLGAAPGFPRDGTWVVRSEGLRLLP